MCMVSKSIDLDIVYHGLFKLFKIFIFNSSMSNLLYSTIKFNY